MRRVRPRVVWSCADTDEVRLEQHPRFRLLFLPSYGYRGEQQLRACGIDTTVQKNHGGTIGGPTTDGYIWLGTATGLYQFDGTHFERYAPLDQKLPARIVESLYAAADNGLLVGFRDGGASLIRDGVVSVYPVAGDVKAPPEIEESLICDLGRGVSLLRSHRR
jgi:hypothetical protein